MTALTYSLEPSQVVGNSDGGVGYGEERFKTTFSQSDKDVLCQIDKCRVLQAIIRTFGAEKSDMKTSKMRLICMITINLSCGRIHMKAVDPKKLNGSLILRPTY
ncbi:hypothetical protein [Halolactibacillus halophilus]|uniref:Uncharacterized protein n=2 Tax=Halolactibacillus halophilus TaxID=306540 RepID=A0ABQ0VP61_9BACI|nr:hypothetical protein [Halolactibacillus halophilus]GEM02916.1 hypothetical protein HHA03_24480 [Halolactibacillus halophilus]